MSQPIQKSFVRLYVCPLLLNLLVFLPHGPTSATAEPFAIQISDSARFSPPGSSLVFYRGEILLPANGMWNASLPTNTSEISELYLMPSKNAKPTDPERLRSYIERQKRIAQAQALLNALFWPCLEYSRMHNRSGPAKIQDLDRNPYSYLLEDLSSAADSSLFGSLTNNFPFFLLPDAPFTQTPSENENILQKHVLAIETRPAVDDGMHWVLYTDGSCRREPLRKDLMEKYNVNVLAATPPASLSSYDIPYIIVLAAPASCSEAFNLVFSNAASGIKLSAVWQPRSSPENKQLVISDLRAARIQTWTSYAYWNYSPILDSWLEFYGADIPERKNIALINDNLPIPVHTFGGIGALIRHRASIGREFETAGKSENVSVPLAAIATIANIPHTAEGTLVDKPSAFPLAKWAPRDHAFVYVAKPPVLADILNGGGKTLLDLAMTQTGLAIDYEVTRKISSRLGLASNQLTKFLFSESVKDMALLLPDTEILDGTEITVIMRLTDRSESTSGITSIGLGALTNATKVIIPTEFGRQAFWARRENVIIGSSSSAEFDSIMSIILSDSKVPTNTLACSPEFQKAEEIFPLLPSSVVYLFASQEYWNRLHSLPFLAGRIKRLGALNDMYRIIAGALLAKLDGLTTTNLSQLADMGYLPARLRYGDYCLDSDLNPVSKLFGPFASPAALSSVMVDSLTVEEASVLRSEIAEMSASRFSTDSWLALRLDREARDTEISLVLHPFISLPLAQKLSRLIGYPYTGEQLRIPALLPQPSTMYSFFLSPSSRCRLVEIIAPCLEQMGCHDLSFLEAVGPRLHFAFYCTDGTHSKIERFFDEMEHICDLLGKEKNGEHLMQIVKDGCLAIIADLKDPPRVVNALSLICSALPQSADRHKYLLPMRTDHNGRATWIAGSWIGNDFQPSFMITVDGSFLLLQNANDSTEKQICRVEPGSAAGLTVQMFKETDRRAKSLPSSIPLRAALLNASALYPLIVSGVATPETAPAEHSRLFGFLPFHPGKGGWVWRNWILASTTFGSVFAPKLADQQSDELWPAYINLQISIYGQYLRVIAQWPHR